VDPWEFSERCMLPPAMPGAASAERPVNRRDSLKGAVAELLVAEARAAFRAIDQTRFEAALAGLVELATGPARRG